jgi:hypothetical protein
MGLGGHLDGRQHTERAVDRQPMAFDDEHKNIRGEERLNRPPRLDFGEKYFEAALLEIFRRIGLTLRLRFCDTEIWLHGAEHARAVSCGKIRNVFSASPLERGRRQEEPSCQLPYPPTRSTYWTR